LVVQETSYVVPNVVENKVPVKNRTAQESPVVHEPSYSAVVQSSVPPALLSVPSTPLVANNERVQSAAHSPANNPIDNKPVQEAHNSTIKRGMHANMLFAVAAIVPVVAQAAPQEKVDVVTPVPIMPAVQQTAPSLNIPSTFTPYGNDSLTSFFREHGLPEKDISASIRATMKLPGNEDLLEQGNDYLRTVHVGKKGKWERAPDGLPDRLKEGKTYAIAVVTDRPSTVPRYESMLNTANEAVAPKNIEAVVHETSLPVAPPIVQTSTSSKYVAPHTAYSQSTVEVRRRNKENINQKVTGSAHRKYAPYALPAFEVAKINNESHSSLIAPPLNNERVYCPQKMVTGDVPLSVLPEMKNTQTVISKFIDLPYTTKTPGPQFDLLNATNTLMFSNIRSQTVPSLSSMLWEIRRHAM
jgi:hypothetical protein